ncbi:MAG: 5-(carboxyamino)imidazole ribonucleotide mutase [Bacteroidetes bacterium]|nr:5-(carboxyamino)imidazole ribonucleotide mutase [Bacteroidota bacterium]
MSKVLILLGSKSDIPVMQDSVKYLDWFGIENEMIVASAHRDPEKVVELTTGAKGAGYECIIAAAGMAAALPGVVSAHTSLPVLGVPLEGGLPGGVDALYSIVQMPPGLPVGTLGVGKPGARNAAILAARILALHNDQLVAKLEEFRQMGYKL